MLDIINKHLGDIEEICRDYRVAELYLFGSALTRDFDEKNSDIDLAVVFQKDIPFEQVSDNYFGFINALEKVLGKSIDLVSLDYVKNPFFREELEKTMRPIYAA